LFIVVSLNGGNYNMSFAGDHLLEKFLVYIMYKTEKGDLQLYMLLQIEAI
jgi:hypothetical protein